MLAPRIVTDATSRTFIFATRNIETGRQNLHIGRISGIMPSGQKGKIRRSGYNTDKTPYENQENRETGLRRSTHMRTEDRVHR